MKRDLTPYHLGGSLYIPATHKNLFSTLLEGKIAGMRSVIIDFEDAINEGDVKVSQGHLAELLKKLPDQELLIFVRPRSIKHLKSLLKMEHSYKLDGFVLAKCDTTNMKAYFKLLKNRNFWVMPVLESVEVFEPKKLHKILDYFKKKQKDILSLRFGAEDLSSHLGLKRSCEETLYDMPVLVQLLSQLILQVKPKGFSITAPVFTCFKNLPGLRSEVKKDLQAGFFGKTLIHPSQVAEVNNLFKVSKTDYESALKVSQTNAAAIISDQGVMLETIPHRRWAKGILLRKELYGVA